MYVLVDVFTHSVGWTARYLASSSRKRTAILARDSDRLSDDDGGFKASGACEEVRVMLLVAVEMSSSSQHNCPLISPQLRRCYVVT